MFFLLLFCFWAWYLHSFFSISPSPTLKYFTILWIIWLLFQTDLQQANEQCQSEHEEAAAALWWCLHLLQVGIRAQVLRRGKHATARLQNQLLFKWQTRELNLTLASSQCTCQILLTFPFFQNILWTFFEIILILYHLL